MLRRWIVIFVAVTLMAIAALGGTLVWTAMHSSSAGAIDCFASPFSLSPRSPQHAVFTARLIRVAHAGRVDDHWGGDWAVGVVEESFWGLPAWFPHFVLLINNTYWENTTVLVSGGREQGILTRFLPIVDTRLGCGYFSYRMPDAQIYLRLLRKPPASAMNRITGYVRSRRPVGSASGSSGQSTTIVPHMYSAWPIGAYKELFRGDSVRYVAMPGAIVRVTGSSGSWDFMTDQDGIYLTSDLPAGGYTVQLLNPPPNQVSHFERVGRYGMSGKGFWTLNLSTQWAGTIEGNVRDVSGKPGFAFLELQNADGASVGSEMAYEAKTNDDGTFLFAGLPMGGRYLLRMNPYGPQEYSPYAPLYYPSAERREEGEVLEINEKERHVQNLNFKVTPLVERTLRIRVAWPNGGQIGEEFFCIVYEEGREYTHRQCGGIESDGTAELPVFGDGPVRVFAYAVVNRNEELHYSRAVELEPAKLPRMLDLTITSSDPQPY